MKARSKLVTAIGIAVSVAALLAGGTVAAQAEETPERASGQIVAESSESPGPVSVGRTPEHLISPSQSNAVGTSVEEAESLGENANQYDLNRWAARKAWRFWRSEGWPTSRKDVHVGREVWTGGARFMNKERRLPHNRPTNYHEYDMNTHDNMERRDAMRIVVDLKDPLRRRWYTTDHYTSFKKF